jgi:hypothetical protein
MNAEGRPEGRPADSRTEHIGVGGYRTSTHHDLRLRYRLPGAPRGELHSFSSCAFCGSKTDLHPTILAATRAGAMVCNDFVGCLRRRVRTAA